MKFQIKIVRKREAADMVEALRDGAFNGMESGGDEMAIVVGESVMDLARYPSGRLKDTVQYEPLSSSGSVTTGRVFAGTGFGTDYAMAFEYGATLHFVPYAEADQRLRDGLYPHVRPVYKRSQAETSGNKPSASYKSNYTTKYKGTPIGYLVSSSPHPFMEEGFEASKDTVVREIGNSIASALEMS